MKPATIKIGQNALKSTPRPVQYIPRTAAVYWNPLLARAISKNPRTRSFVFQSPRYLSHQAEPQGPIPPIGAENTYDIVIIGGANAGLALVCALLSHPTISKTTRILLLEGSSLDKIRHWPESSEWENRISSLTHENIQWLESIGVWKHVKQKRSCPVHEIIIWSNPSADSTPTIHFPSIGRPLARMTENLNLQQALLKRINEIGQGIVDIRESSKVAEMRLGESDRWVGLRIGDEWVRGSLVVGADGPNSPVRHFSKIESFGHGYRTHAVVATLHHEADTLYPNTTAFQRFLPTGPIVFLPLSSTCSTMVWSTLPNHAVALKKLSPEALTQMINAGYTLPEETLGQLFAAVLSAQESETPLTANQISTLIATLPSAPMSADQPILPPTITSIHAPSVASFPLRLSHAASYLGKRTALVGDSAHTIHPLAGQGLNMGLADVDCLARTLERTKQLGGDLGSLEGTKGYPKERYPLNHLMLSTTDKLHYIFRARNGLINWVRGTGLDVINELEPIKKILMGGAGSGVGMGGRGTKRTEKERVFGRAKAGDDLKTTDGLPMTVANGIEGWFALKEVMSMIGGVVEEATKNGLRRAADVLDKRRH
ncbi:ubiquinone biosynthesis monooxygenase COQ6 [Cryptococcus depauperatus]|nr:ubiquinone biosynthesis monooxygenase COQ6 [Cryptococcus depauperatus CBS 7855]